MRKLSYFVMLIAGCSLMFSCIDNDESDSIKKIREAKASEILAQAGLLEAQAEAEKLIAEADAEYTKALAKVQVATAAKIEAEAAYQEIVNKIKDLERQVAEGKLTAEIEAAIAEAKSRAAKYAASIQEYENDLKKWKYELELLDMEYAYKLEASELKYAQALTNLKAQIASEMAGATAEVRKALSEYYTLMTTISGEELDAVKLSLEIKQLEAAYKFAEFSEKMDKNQFILQIRKAHASAVQSLEEAEEELAIWKALEKDIASAEKLIAIAEGELAELKADRIDAYNAKEAAKDLYEASEEAYDELDDLVSNGFTWYSDGDPANDGIQQTTYTSLTNGNVYDMGNSVEALKSVIAVAEADVVDLKAAYAIAEADYNAAIADIQDVVDADMAAFKTLETATANWETAYENYFYNGTASKSAFLAADKAYCEAYCKYYGGTADGTQLRPDGSNSIQVLTNYTISHNNPTTFPGVNNPTTVQALADATTAWNNAYTNFVLTTPATITGDQFIAIDRAYCEAYYSLNGGTADGSTEPRPQGPTPVVINEWAVYPTGADYEGTRVIYARVSGEAIGHKNTMDNIQDALDGLARTIPSMNEVVAAYGKIDAAKAKYMEAFEDYSKKEIAYDLIEEAIADKKDLIDELEMIQTILAFDEGAGDTHALAIEYIEDKIEELTDKIEGKDVAGVWQQGLRDDVTEKQFDLENFETKWAEAQNGHLTLEEMLDYLQKTIETKKVDLTALEYKITGLKTLADQLKDALDELLA